MEPTRFIQGTDVVAKVSGEKPWSFAYPGSQAMTIDAMPDPEPEALFDALWALAAPLGFTGVALVYRVGDPFETYAVRP